MKLRALDAPDVSHGGGGPVDEAEDVIQVENLEFFVVPGSIFEFRVDLFCACAEL